MLSDPWSVAHVSALEILHQLLYNHGTLIVILGSSSGVQLGLGPFQNKKKNFSDCLVGPKGVEPLTFRSEVERSIQLS